jgi:hypothetical protein
MNFNPFRISTANNFPQNKFHEILVLTITKFKYFYQHVFWAVNSKYLIGIDYMDYGLEIYGLPDLRVQILNIWMIQTTQDISTKSKPLIAK